MPVCGNYLFFELPKKIVLNPKDGCKPVSYTHLRAQLIATVHDISLLDCKTLFRKEQIWFACKDKEHAYLYSLAEFTAEKDNIRDTSDIIEKYKRGMLGALPEPEFFESLLEVKNDVETAEH